jgi:hypothetical protein
MPTLNNSKMLIMSPPRHGIPGPTARESRMVWARIANSDSTEKR